MSGLLQKLAEADKLSCNILIELIFEAQKEQSLYILLKHADDQTKNNFYRKLDEFELQWFEERIKKIAEVTGEAVEAAEGELLIIFETLSTKVQELEDLTEKNNQQLRINREVMKAQYIQAPGLSDQLRGFPMPEPAKTIADGAALITLPQPDETVIKKRHIFPCLRDRKSKRNYTQEKMNLDELAYLLWATQGVKQVILNGKLTLRTVPSAGARHPFETYLAIMRVTDLEPGIYSYAPLKHALVFHRADSDLPQSISKGTFGQEFAGNAAVVFFWSVVPYRCEWRYTVAAQKLMLLDAGHICQNLYLACESIGYGTCAVAAYSQNAMDELLGLDGEDEFVVYLAPVGKVRDAILNEKEV